MNSEKNYKNQRKAFVKTIKSLIYIATSNPFHSDKVSLTLPRIPNMNKENIKPILEEALGYLPEIILYQETEISGDKNETIPVVLLIIKLSQQK